MSELQQNPGRDPGLEQLIHKISTEHGFDVRGYKRSTLYRRIRKRMADVGAADLDDYAVRLETDRHEYPQLINTVLINVTEFFRDPEAWAHLKNEVLPHLIAERSPGEPVRMWCAGCATGEEPYSLAISAAELLGDRSLRDLKIYATDVDEGALAVARAAVYGPDDLRNVSPERLERFFEPLPAGRYAVRRELRSAVIFGRHNVQSDAPISRLDLLVCRNLLIYFDTQTQLQILSRFHYGLREQAVLFLGKAETLMARSQLFRPLEPRYRIFQKGQRGAGEELAPPLFDGARAVRRPPEVQPSGQTLLLQSLLEQSPEPILILEPSGVMVSASAGARELFRLRDEDLGRNVLELEERYRPVALRLALDEARTNCRAAQVEELAFESRDGRPVWLRLDVRPLLDPKGALVRIVIRGRDCTREHELQEELFHARSELETLGEELQTTNEELETTNEELQSTNEELETTNEELQSTNEELETTVEELQSTNEELETANDELRAREEELNSRTQYQESILSSLEIGVFVLNRDYTVTSWSRACSETWGIREEEAVGRELFTLDIGLPLGELREPLGLVATGQSPQETVRVSATNRRGRSIECEVRMHPLLDRDRARLGSVVVVEQIGEPSA